MSGHPLVAGEGQANMLTQQGGALLEVLTALVFLAIVIYSTLSGVTRTITTVNSAKMSEKQRAIPLELWNSCVTSAVGEGPVVYACRDKQDQKKVRFYVQ